MEILRTQTVGEIVKENYNSTEVFYKYGIDFCCGGRQSISEACEKKGIPYAVIERDLNRVNNHDAHGYNYDEWDLDFLIDYIVLVHHKYVSENIPMILQFSNKVARVHGKRNPETIVINKQFEMIAKELSQHMQKEEMILFPSIEKLVLSGEKGLGNPSLPFGSIRGPINVMLDEHENAGDIMENIRVISNNYTPPIGACTTYAVLYAKLKEFEKNLHQHVHLENNILFPKALHIEQNLQIESRT